MSSRKPIVSAVLLILLLVVVAVVPSSFAAAQGGTHPPAQFGDPPTAALISISEPDADGLVIIRGEMGAVFPGAVVAIRNMYTGQTVYPRAEVTGAFVGQLYGPGNTPFWISPANRIETIERNVAGSLPGGPGVILYGPLPESVTPPEPIPPAESTLPETPVVIDGQAAEWASLVSPQPVELGDGHNGLLYARANTESIFLAIAPADADQVLPKGYGVLTIGLDVAGRAFRVTLDPRRGDSGRLYDATRPDRLVDLGPLGADSAQQDGPDGAVELRLPRLAFTGWAAPVTVNLLYFVPPTCCREEVPISLPVELSIPVEERDEIDTRTFGAMSTMPIGGTPFTLSGAVGGGSGTWQAAGWINSLDLAGGGDLAVEMQVTMAAPEMPGDGADLRLGAALRLEPVAVNGGQTVADRATGNGWSGILTPTGLAVENVPGGVPLGEVAARDLVIAGDVLTFRLRWALPLDEAIPPGLYTPALTGFAAVTGVYNTWEESGLLGSGAGVGVPEVRLPVVVRIGDPPSSRLLWVLFQDNPASSGARGILPQEDAGQLALSSRVGFSGGAYILPRVNPQNHEPIAYPLEPYLPAMLGNSFYQTVPPLVPFDFASGELTVTVTRPDGTVDDLGTVPIVQNTLSTSTRIEARALGGSSPVDVYRLTTLDPRLTAYTFEQDGRHVIAMSGTVRDIWGHEYTGGGTYEVWLAEPLLLFPGVLPGTPFEVGDAFNQTLTIAPAFPADVAVHLQVFPLDGGEPLVYNLSGTASSYGYFHAERDAAVWRMTMPGEYVVDVTATYTDSLGKLWMGSARGAGVIASPEGTLIARGGRGLANLATEDRLAWFELDHLEPDLLWTNPDVRLRWPYHSGDTLWLEDPIGRIKAALRLTDTTGDYAAWLMANMPGWRADDGLTVAELANEDELPVVTLGPTGAPVDAALDPSAITNRAYAYLSAVRPGLSLRQLVLGDETTSLILPGWSLDDPYNYQRGVGLNGDLPGDYAFLFGGIVVENEALALRETAIYGSVLLVDDPDTGRGTRVYPPLRGAANGPDGGPLLTLGTQELPLFFISTGFQPGQVLTVGEPLVLAGQVAPALPALVSAEIVTPDGRILPLGGRANAVGYFYDPTQTLTFNEPGIWRIRLRVSYDGVTSAGPVQGVSPTGTVPGAMTGEFAVYVLPAESGVVPVDNPAFADGYLPTALPYNITVSVPAGWSHVQFNYTVLMSGMILDSGVQPAYGDVYAYNFDPRRLSRTFLNLDTVQTGTQTPATADAVRITLVLSGVDAEGQPVMASRTLLMIGDRLIAQYDGWPEPQ